MAGRKYRSENTGALAIWAPGSYWQKVSGKPRGCQVYSRLGEKNLLKCNFVPVLLRSKEPLFIWRRRFPPISGAFDMLTEIRDLGLSSSQVSAPTPAGRMRCLRISPPAFGPSQAARSAPGMAILPPPIGDMLGVGLKYRDWAMALTDGISPPQPSPRRERKQSQYAVGAVAPPLCGLSWNDV